MWELIINAIGWIVGGSLEGRAAAINRKTGKVSSASELEISEISGEAGETAAREKTKQQFLKTIETTTKSENEKMKPSPTIIAGSILVVLAALFFYFRTAEQNNGNKKDD
jgi:cobalamin biosynthesis Mg chelatase CobN